MVKVQRLQHASVPMPPGGNEAARAFYGGTLGLEEVPPPDTLDVERLVWFRVGADGHEIHVFTEAGNGPSSPGQHLCLQVDDLAAMHQRLSDAGIAIEDPTAIPNRPRFFIHDPFGNRIELTQITGNYRES